MLGAEGGEKEGVVLEGEIAEEEAARALVAAAPYDLYERGLLLLHHGLYLLLLIFIMGPCSFSCSFRS